MEVLHNSTFNVVTQLKYRMEWCLISTLDCYTCVDITTRAHTHTYTHRLVHMHGHYVGITCACTHICTHAYTGPSSVLPTWYLSSWGSQWSSSRLHDHCQETDLHLLPDVQADANWSQPWDCPLQHEQKVKERYLRKGKSWLSMQIWKQFTSKSTMTGKILVWYLYVCWLCLFLWMQEGHVNTSVPCVDYWLRIQECQPIA